MQATIYARFSTDKQSDTSIEDQARGCRARALREGWPIAALISDDGVSGSTPVSARPGGHQLLADALAGRFQILLLEGLDRLSRDLVEQERIVRRLEHRDIRIIGISDGYDSQSKARKLHRGMRGLINEVYLDDLRAKTHRGLAGQVGRGFHAGGLSYGYRSTGDDAGHKLQIDQAQAEVVRWIFAQYAAGWSCQRLAADLNRRGVPSPRGSSWCVSGLYGSPDKGSGILNNELYVGRYIWNRSQWLKDPDTGRRQRIARPRDEWMIEDRPDLRILDDTAWQAARERMARPTAAGGSKGKGAAPRTLFGGMLRCGQCGGAVVAINTRTYGCAARKDRGETVCSGINVPREATDSRLLTAARDELLAPESLAELQRLVARELKTTGPGSSKKAAKARLDQLERQIAHLVDAIADAGMSESLKTRLKAAEAERATLQANPPEIAPQAADGAVLARYRRMVANLQASLKADTAAARQALREIMGDIRLVTEAGGIYAEIETRQKQLLTASGVSLGVVAGAGFVTQKRIRIV